MIHNIAAKVNFPPNSLAKKCYLQKIGSFSFINTLKLPINGDLLHQHYNPTKESRALLSAPIQFCGITWQVLEHVMSCYDLTLFEKFCYLFLDFYAKLNLDSCNCKTRSVTFPVRRLAEILNRSPATIVKTQKKLERLGYLDIQRSRSKCGKNNINVITPTLPDSVFNKMLEQEDKHATSSLHLSKIIKCKRTVLDKTKMFIPFDIQSTKNVLLDQGSDTSSKLTYLGIYSNIHKSKTKQGRKDYLATISLKKLQEDLNMGKTSFFKAMKELEEQGLIARQRVFVKSEDDSSNCYNKSLYAIGILVKQEEQHKYMVSNTDLTTKKEDLIQDKEVKICSTDNNKTLPEINRSSPSETPKFAICNIIVKRTVIKEVDIDRKSSFTDIQKKEFGIKKKVIIQQRKKDYFSTAISSKAKTLADFDNFTEEEAYLLRKMSGRSFSLNAMNEILKDMKSRLSGRFFASKSRFMSYMAKAFTYEMRQAAVINDSDFKIKANKTEKERQEEIQERFLSKIEDSFDISPVGRLKKKLANVLNSKTAYQLLKHCRSINRIGQLLTIHLTKNVELTKLDREIIHAQARPLWERGIDQAADQLQRLEIVMPDKYNSDRFNQVATNQKADTSSTRLIQVPIGIWGRVRERLTEQYGKGADGAWFSGISAKEDKFEKTLTLEVKSSFVRNWIESNYIENIKKITEEEGYSLKKSE